MSLVTLNLVIAVFALVQGLRYGPRALRFLAALCRPEARQGLRPADAIPLAVVLVSLALLASAGRILLAR